MYLRISLALRGEPGEVVEISGIQLSYECLIPIFLVKFPWTRLQAICDIIKILWVCQSFFMPPGDLAHFSLTGM